MAVPPAPIRGPSQWPLAPSQSANDKGDNDMIPGAVHRFPLIYLTAAENPGKSKLGDRQ